MKLLWLLLSTFPFAALAQGNALELNGMKFFYRLYLDSVEITISAPTTGWIGVGFNSKNDIVGSDLLLFHVVDGNPESLDMYVKGFGDPRQDHTLGGVNSIRILSAEESTRKTKITFKIPIRNDDHFDYQHTVGKDFWLILAYSTHDEFDHHSRMRKHLVYRFDY